MLIALEPGGIFGSKFAYLFILTLSSIKIKLLSQKRLNLLFVAVLQAKKKRLNKLLFVTFG